MTEKPGFLIFRSRIKPLPSSNNYAVQPRSNRTAVAFAITSSSVETAYALKAGSSFALDRPLTFESLRHTLQAAYGMIVRERRCYFRYPISVPAAASKKGELEIFGETVNVSERGVAFSGSNAAWTRRGGDDAVHPDEPSTRY